MAAVAAERVAGSPTSLRGYAEASLKLKKEPDTMAAVFSIISRREVEAGDKLSTAVERRSIQDSKALKNISKIMEFGVC